MNDYKFGNFLCSLREAKGMTQLELADMLDVTTAAVSKWENGESKPKLETLFRLGEIFGVTAEELVAGEFSVEKIKTEKGKFRFNIRITEQDYTDFNVFCILNTPYGKKQIRTYRLAVAFIVAIAMLTVVILTDSYVTITAEAIALGLLLLVLELSVKKRLVSSVKRQVKLLRKGVKKVYSPFSAIEFYENAFVENDGEAKTQQSYSSVERVSIAENKVIYLHINDIRAYIIPISSFVSAQQYSEFVAFIKSKCALVEVY